jgi:hypothetical protein
MITMNTFVAAADAIEVTIINRLSDRQEPRT